MTMLLSLAWRCLLVASLVLNPVAGAAAMLAADADAAVQRAKAAASAIASEELPPCHKTANASPSPLEIAPAAPGKHHGDCGDTACQFAACCAVGALDLSTPLLASWLFPGAQALPSLDLRQASAPPPARMIRPPIA